MNIQIPHQPIYVHGIHRQKILAVKPTIPFHLRIRRPFGCSCIPPFHICDKCIPLMWASPFPYPIPLRYFGISDRKEGCCVVDAIGSRDPEQFKGLLRTWGVPDSAVEHESIQKAELKGFPMRSDVPQLVNTFRKFLVSPCPNALDEQVIVDDPDYKREISDPGKRIHLYGRLSHTNLPDFGLGIYYTIIVYLIPRLSRCSWANTIANCEIRMHSKGGLPEKHLPAALKGMGQFLLAGFQAADISTLEIPSGSRIKGEPYTVKGRGRGISRGDLAMAGALADLVGRDDPNYPYPSRSTLLASLCLTLGRRLSPNTVAECLNWGGAFWRRVSTRNYLCPPSNRIAASA